MDRCEWEPFGIGRPYRDRDPHHMGPIDGMEYIARRGGAKAAATDVKKRAIQATQEKRGVAKLPVVAKSPRVRAT